MKIKQFNPKPPRIEMLPLIDIVFLLLVVFIYTMLSMAVHKGMPVDLPSGEQIRLQEESLISVTITADGTLFVNKIPIELTQLPLALKQRPEVDAETDVLLFADKTVSYQVLFRVLDRIRQAGLHRISLQAESEEKP
jgi:biopolymer transport protein ExbD